MARDMMAGFLNQQVRRPCLCLYPGLLIAVTKSQLLKHLLLPEVVYWELLFFPVLPRARGKLSHGCIHKRCLQWLSMEKSMFPWHEWCRLLVKIKYNSCFRVGLHWYLTASVLIILWLSSLYIALVVLAQEFISQHGESGWWTEPYLNSSLQKWFMWTHFTSLFWFVAQLGIWEGDSEGQRVWVICQECWITGFKLVVKLLCFYESCSENSFEKVEILDKCLCLTFVDCTVYSQSVILFLFLLLCNCCS